MLTELAKPDHLAAGQVAEHVSSYQTPAASESVGSLQRVKELQQECFAEVSDPSQRWQTLPMAQPPPWPSLAAVVALTLASSSNGSGGGSNGSGGISGCVVVVGVGAAVVVVTQ